MRAIPAVLLSLAACAGRPPADPGLGKSGREEKNGWIHIRLEGSPREIGYQHGALLAEEIADALKMFAHFLKGSTEKDWTFYRDAAERMFWPKLEKEYQEEIEAIAEGARSRGASCDRTDITAMNGWIELAWYFVPFLAEREKRGPVNNKAPGKCSAFIATGSYTEDGNVVMAHNTWVDYVVGERWNIVADVRPARGHRFIMDTFPGLIHSASDFVINDAGILTTETTIGQFKGFDESGVPEFMRARKAAQYAASIDEFVTIMTKPTTSTRTRERRRTAAASCAATARRTRGACRSSAGRRSIPRAPSRRGSPRPRSPGTSSSGPGWATRAAGTSSPPGSWRSARNSSGRRSSSAT